MWDRPTPGLEPMSPALAGRFLTTVPPGKSPDSFYKTRITPVSMPDKDATRKLQTNIPNEYRCKNPQQNISKMNSAADEEDHTP